MEFRHKERRHLMLYLDIVEKGTDRLLGHLGDISGEGVMILAPHPMALHVKRNIQIKLPDFEEFSKPSLDVTVETRWVKRDSNPSIHCVGCLFLDLDPNDLPLIEQICEELGFND